MKRSYEADEIVTFYFIINDTDLSKNIQAWTDDKEIAKFYMDIHKCNSYKLKKMNGYYSDIAKILNEAANDEISLCNIAVADPDHKKNKNPSKLMIAPLTTTEQLFVSEESKTFLASRINYSYINDAFHYLRRKYQNALKDIFLEEIMEYVIYNKNSRFVESLEMDQLMVLVKSMPEHFGS